MEPEAITDALRLETVAGAQCVVATTEDITQARLAHLRMDSDAPRLAHAAITAAQKVKPQHLLVEIGPCGLPLDASSKASLNENRAQYANAARAFADEEFDAFFLNGFSSIVDLKCALMGLAQVSDKPIFASVALGRCDWFAQNTEQQSASSTEKPAISLPFGGDYEEVEEAMAPPLPAASRTRLAIEAWPEAIDAMVDLGAAVVGFETTDPIADALSYVKIATERTDLPILTQLRVTNAPSGLAAKKLIPLEDIDEYTPDTMTAAAVKLYGAGVQFLRATGAATPAYTGALAATVSGLDVHRS
jgi:5-methyltetrahydrofolate--homocysteine methyltransferase